MQSSRRKFLRDSSVLAVAGFAAHHSSALGQEEGPTTKPDTPALQTPPSTRRGEMLYRKLGGTGVEVSLIGIGGFHVGSIKDAAEATRIIRTGVDRGITFLDNSWD